MAIVTAVLTVVDCEHDAQLGAALEEAMSDAVTQALEAGVSIHDTPTILEWKQQAYDAVMERYGAR